MPAARKRKMIRLKQIRRGVGATREMRSALKTLGLGKLYQFSEIPDTKEVRALIDKVPHLVSILDGPDILFPREKSTLGEERIRDMVEAARAAMSASVVNTLAANDDVEGSALTSVAVHRFKRTLDRDVREYAELLISEDGSTAEEFAKKLGKPMKEIRNLDRKLSRTKRA